MGSFEPTELSNKKEVSMSNIVYCDGPIELRVYNSEGKVIPTITTDHHEVNVVKIRNMLRARAVEEVYYSLHSDNLVLPDSLYDELIPLIKRLKLDSVDYYFYKVNAWNARGKYFEIAYTKSFITERNINWSNLINYNTVDELVNNVIKSSIGKCLTTGMSYIDAYEISKERAFNLNLEELLEKEYNGESFSKLNRSATPLKYNYKKDLSI